MNLNKEHIHQKGMELHSKQPVTTRRRLLFLFKIGLACVLIFVIGAACMAGGAIHAIIKNVPDISSEDVKPQGYASVIYDASGGQMQRLATDGSNRDESSYDELPKDLINAFISIEDSRFYRHNGIDLKGIFRAAIVGITTGNFSEGGSTITQQLIKNNFLNGGFETSFGERLERKIQEQYLAVQLEKTMSKAEILLDYLNTINLGSNTLGVQAASKRYFGKDVSDLTLSECSVLAAITQNPTRYNPVTHPEENARRRGTVLEYMRNNGYISNDEYNEAASDDVYARIQNIADSSDSTSVFSYFTDQVFSNVVSDLQTELGYSQTQAYNMIYSNGLSIYATMDPDIQDIMDEQINDVSNYVSDASRLLEYALSYRLIVTSKDGTQTTYNENDVTNYHKQVLNKPAYKNIFSSKSDMNRAVQEFKKSVLSSTDTIEEEVIESILQPQASMVVMDQSTGRVLAISGGRGEKTGSLTLNRATDSLRQPGSSFSVLASYAPALDSTDATLARSYYDAPYNANNQQYVDWWGTTYLGYNNLRQAITYSMNIVSLKCLVNTVRPSIGYDYAVNFGISTLTDNDKIPNLAIGNLNTGATNLEMTAAYAAIANDGVYQEPVFYTKVVDREGRVILSNESESHRVIQSTTASLMTSAMESCVSADSIYSSYGLEPTGQECKIPGIPIAGKSGSSVNSNDVWFIGYSPLYTCGIWSGYDESKAIGTNQNYHKRIWQKVMSEIHALDKNAVRTKKLEFPENRTLVTAKICSKSGLLAIEGICDQAGGDCQVYDELFAEGTAPTEYCDLHYALTICKTSGDIATDFCPASDRITQIFIRLRDSDSQILAGTLDTALLAPKNQTTCQSHVQAKEEETSASYELAEGSGQVDYLDVIVEDDTIESETDD